MNKRDRDNEMLFLKAELAGMEAAKAAQVAPMMVAQHQNPLNDNSPVKKSWFVEGGVCGFAWVNIKPGTSSFAKWLKENKNGYVDYYGGMSYSVNGYGQSMQRKEAHAIAFARVLNENGVLAYCMSRMD